jgi:hypothetical protein
MCRLSAWTVAIVVLTAPAYARAGDADTDETAAKGSWFSRLFPGKSQPPAKPKDKKAEKNEAAERHAISMKAAVAAQAREKSDWLRRVAVCDKLRDIAILTNDAELLRKADSLDQRAWDTYQKRTARLPAGPAGTQSDERILERRLGTSTSISQSLLPAGGASSSGQAAILEVR